ncbi:caspase family protein [Gracilimonas sp.]|uniref:caspase family protein n=1 Tax=Gracilimonas sp. TaxID=1974203 RepID=UPI002870E1AF|nr:caspase family protein [Gracilimonas sp.]
MGLNFRLTIVYLSLALLLIQGCSVTSWTVVDDGATDTSDFEIIDTRYYLEEGNNVSPEQPVINFKIKAVNYYEYTQRVKAERYIQQYRPRLGYVMLGAAAAGISYYAAFSDQLLSEPTNPQRYALVGAGTMLTGLSFLNMKPIDEPSPTGESKLLRRTGTIVDADTSDARPYDESIQPMMSINYGDTVLTRNEARSFNNGSISINLADEIDASIFPENPSDSIFIEIRYDSLTTSKEVQVSSVFEQFVIVDAQITALRNEPEIDNNNVLTDLAAGSQLEFLEKVGDWYKVLYGLSETWVSANDVRTVWRPSAFASDLSVITIPNVPFGSVDVEQNIPEILQVNRNSTAVIISNSQYEGDYTERIYGDRDAELMEAYFTQALGVRQSNMLKAIDINSMLDLNRTYSRLANNIQDSLHSAAIYINGYAEIEDSTVFLIGSNLGREINKLNLNTYFSQLAELDLHSLTIIADLDFIENQSYEGVLIRLADSVISNNINSAVLFSSQPGQRSGIYSSSFGDQNRHSIFTYFLADALKQNKLLVRELFDHLERNVSFTSRSIYDLPQTPLLFGNPEIELLR